MTFEREIRYQVIKLKTGKPVDCVVVEADWPEYETVWRMIKDRVEGREQMSYDVVKQLREQLAAMTAERDEAIKIRNEAIIENNISRHQRDELVAAVLIVCCDPEGRVVIRGSDGDRAVLQAALAKVGKGE